MQKFTIHPVILAHRKNSQDMVSIKIAVTVQRKVTYIPTPFRINIHQWNDANKAVVKHENANVMNVSIRRQIADIERELINAGMQGIQLTKRIIKGEAIASKLFVVYAKEVRYDQTRLNRIIAYAGTQLMLTDITVEWLRKFETWLRQKKYSQNTMNITFKYVGRIINQAKKEGLIKDNPFEQYTKPKYQQSDRVYLVESELEKLVAWMDYPMQKSMHVTLCYFLLGCYTGLRHSDWVRFDMTRVEDGYVKLRAKKNKTFVVLPIGITLTKVLAKIEKLPKPLSNQKSNQLLKGIAAVAGIEKNITTHSGRHSFGCMCAGKGLPESTTAALLGVSAKTVKVYYHLTGENIKQQAEALLYV